MIPASAAAEQQGVNSKTVQKCYDILRRNIAAVDEQIVREHIGATAISAGLFADVRVAHQLGSYVEPLFCLVRLGDKDFFLFVVSDAKEQPSAIIGPVILGWIYAKNQKALVALELDRIHFLPVAQATANRTENRFWKHAKQGLVRYHGGFRKNFSLFMREMEFRFNNQNETSGLLVLMEMLQKDRNL